MEQIVAAKGHIQTGHCRYLVSQEPYTMPKPANCRLSTKAAPWGAAAPPRWAQGSYPADRKDTAKGQFHHSVSPGRSSLLGAACGLCQSHCRWSFYLWCDGRGERKNEQLQANCREGESPQSKVAAHVGVRRPPRKATSDTCNHSTIPTSDSLRSLCPTFTHLKST